MPSKMKAAATGPTAASTQRTTTPSRPTKLSTIATASTTTSRAKAITGSTTTTTAKATKELKVFQNCRFLHRHMFEKKMFFYFLLKSK